MNDQLRELIEVGSKVAEQTFRARGVLQALYRCIDAQGRDHFVPAPDQCSKDDAVAIMRAFMKLKQIARYCFFDEAWTLSYSENDPALANYMDRGGMPRDHPQRREIVMLVAEDDIGMLFAHRDIVRPQKGRPYLGPLSFPDYGKTEGRMVGLLPRRSTLQ